MASDKRVKCKHKTHIGDKECFKSAKKLHVLYALQVRKSALMRTHKGS